MGSKTSEIRNKETTEMLDYGFAQYKLDSLLFRNSNLGEIKINNGYPFVSLLSRLLHNELYIGIRKRTSKFGREEGKEDVVIQHIAPIISEEDFYRAHEMIVNNPKYVQNRGVVYFNPLKELI